MSGMDHEMATTSSVGDRKVMLCAVSKRSNLDSKRPATRAFNLDFFVLFFKDFVVTVLLQLGFAAVASEWLKTNLYAQASKKLDQCIREWNSFMYKTQTILFAGLFEAVFNKRYHVSETKYIKTDDIVSIVCNLVKDKP